MPGLVPDKFSLICEGKEWTQWKSFTVRSSLDSGAATFQMETTDLSVNEQAQWNVRGGSKIEIKIDKELIFSGFVQKYGVNIDGNSHSIKIEGASRSIDAVECSHLGPYFWKNTTAESIIQAVLKPFGFEAKFDKPMKKIGKEGFRVEVEESPFAIIKRLAERDALTVITDWEGNFRLYDGKRAEFAGPIRRGDYTSISADHDLSKAFSEIVVKGQKNSRSKPSVANHATEQRTETRVKNKLRIGTAKNQQDLRYRPIVYVQNGKEDAIKDFAEFVRTRFTGDTITGSVDLKTHINPKGKLWSIGQELFLEEELLDVSQNLAVSEVEFSLSERGFFTKLSVKIPNSYDPTSQPARGEPRRATGQFGNAAKAIWNV